jgi:hypothetical protein
MFKEENVENKKLYQVTVPTHPGSMNLAKTLSDVQSEISFGQIVAPE